MPAIKNEEEASSLREKLRSYLDNLKTVEASLTLEPTHAELLSIKTDLLEIVKILTSRLLEYEKYAADCESKARTSTESSSGPAAILSTKADSSTASEIESEFKSEPSNPELGTSLAAQTLNKSSVCAFLPRPLCIAHSKSPQRTAASESPCEKGLVDYDFDPATPSSPNSHHSDESSSSPSSRLTPPPPPPPPEANLEENLSIPVSFDFQPFPTSEMPVNNLASASAAIMAYYTGCDQALSTPQQTKYDVEFERAPFKLSIKYVKDHLEADEKFADYVAHLHEKIDLDNLSLLPSGIENLVTLLTALDPSMLARAKSQKESGVPVEFKYKETCNYLRRIRDKMKAKQINDQRKDEGLPPVPKKKKR